jgi:hypothetical protein
MPGPIQASQPTPGLVPLQRRQIEADVTIKAEGKQMHVDGDVFIGKRFLPTVVSNVVQSAGVLRNVAIAYHPETDRYAMRGEVKFAGTYWKAAGSTRADVDGHDVVLRDVKFDFPGSGIQWLSNKVRDGIVKGLNSQGIVAAREGSDIRISGSGLLKEAGVLPAWADLTKDTTAKASHDAEGNLTLHFGPGAAGTPDGNSHIKASLDPAASQTVLALALGSGYHLQHADFTEGTIKVHGRTDVPELRDALTAGVAVIGMLSQDLGTLLGANVPSTMPTVGLDMDMRTDGADLVIKPSLRLAVKPVAAELAKGGAPVRTSKEDVRVDINAMVPPGQVLRRIAVTPAGLEIEADVNVDAVLSPKLR